MRGACARVLLLVAGSLAALALAELGSRWLRPIRLHTLIAADGGVLHVGDGGVQHGWLAPGTTDSRPGALSTVEGLGWMSGSHCPHYHAEPQRKPLYWSKIRSGEYKPGYACDDRAGIYFENEEVKRVVSLDEGSNAYFVSAAGGEVSERLLPKEIL